MKIKSGLFKLTAILTRWNLILPLQEQGASMPLQDFQLPKALTLDKQRLVENKLKTALSHNTRVFVKTLH